MPVGEDQEKHIVLTRHLAKVFNRKFGFVFPAPQWITGRFSPFALGNGVLFRYPFFSNLV